MRQLELSHFSKTSQAKLTIEIFDERPHDRSPVSPGGNARPSLFLHCFVSFGILLL